MANDVSSSDNIIDSRDVIERIKELEEQQEAHDDLHGEGDWAEAYPTDAEKLASLTKLQDQAEGYASDWRHGETLINDDYFVEFAQQLAEDSDAIPRDAAWPCTCIDWDKAARDLQMDYNPVDFDGTTFWVR